MAQPTESLPKSCVDLSSGLQDVIDELVLQADQLSPHDTNATRLVFIALEAQAKLNAFNEKAAECSAQSDCNGRRCHGAYDLFLKTQEL